jgi:cysteine-rich repeat protein
MDIRAGSLIRIAAAAVTIVSLLKVGSADASHFRYGHYAWSRVGGNTVEVTLQNAFRRDSDCGCFSVSSGSPVPVSCSAGDGYPQVGDIVDECVGETQFEWGDGDSTGTLLYTITSIDPANNWTFALALDAQSFPNVDTTLSHTYAAPGNYVARTQSCCRISSVDGLNDHVNNPDGNYRVETVINVGTANNSPVSVLPPIVVCPIDDVCSFPIQAADRDGDRLTYRLATSTEAAGSEVIRTCLGCGPVEEAVGACTNACGPPSCSDPSRTIFGGGPGTFACGQFSGDQATCEMAWHLGAGGAASCFFDDGCSGCGPNNEAFGLCTNTCRPAAASCPSRSIFSGDCADLGGDPAACAAAWQVGPAGGSQSCFLEDEGDTGGFIQPGPPHAPNPAQVDATTGVYTWDTAGATLGSDPESRNTLYSSQVVVEDGKSKVALDFLVKVGPGDTDPPCLCPDPGCSNCPEPDPDNPPVCRTTQLLTIGERKTFRIVARDPDQDDAVTLTVAGLPPRATMTPSLPVGASRGNPAASTFSWIPDRSDAGVHVVSFVASSSRGGFVTCPVILEVGRCGDGLLATATDDPEECDDGNRVDGDCCSSRCKIETGSCNDGDACTRRDTCDGNGNCVGSDPVTCGAPTDQCHDAGTCDRQTGACLVIARENTPCDSGDSCRGDTCDAGVCTEVLPCAVEAAEVHVKTIRVTCRGQNGELCRAAGTLAAVPVLAGGLSAAGSNAAIRAGRNSCGRIISGASVGMPVTKSPMRKIKSAGTAHLKLKLNKVGKQLLRCAAAEGQGLEVAVETSISGAEPRLLDFVVRLVKRGS